MQIDTGISYIEHGLKSAIKGMQIQNEFVNLSNQNVIGFDKVGYQRKEIVNSSFQEYMGKDALSTVVDDQVGRITLSDNPLDLALANKGYFQVQDSTGIQLTRDGRFKLDKDGNLLTLNNAKVLGNDGLPIKSSIIPKNVKEVVVNSKGVISVFNPETKKLDKMGTLGIVSADGNLVIDPQVKQGYNEFSNVSLEKEFLGLMMPVRNFDANRQMFMIESSVLSKTIQQLGSAS
ncbi:flagellar hook basal-body protein [bacterium]|nr:flagellar hook basal-body protein [bacterium]